MQIYCKCAVSGTNLPDIQELPITGTNMYRMIAVVLSMLLIISSLSGCLSNSNTTNDDQTEQVRNSNLEIIIQNQDEQISILEQTTMLYRTDLSWSNLSNIDLSHKDLSHSNLSHVNFSNTNLNFTNLNGADLTFVNFNNTHLYGANLSEVRTMGLYNCETAVLPSSWFCREGILIGPKVNLSGANLSGLRLTDMNFHDGDFRSTNFTHAVLSGAHFYNANLRDSNLSGAHLDSAYFNNAIISNSDLTYSNLRYSQLFGADLTDSDFSNAILTEADLRNTTLTGVIWSNTTCPDGTNSNDNGGTCENNIIEPEHIRWD